MSACQAVDLTTAEFPHPHILTPALLCPVFVALFQEALCSYLKHHAAQLKRYTYGKHILVRLEKISGEKML